MRRFLLPLLAAISLPVDVRANIDPKVAEMCMKAVDFQGCVNAMTGKKEGKRIIMDQGVSLSEGNACPANYAYVGGGTCQQVKCFGSGLFLTIGGRSDETLKKYGWKVGLAIFMYYLIRDVTLYIILPYLIMRGFFS